MTDCSEGDNGSHMYTHCVNTEGNYTCEGFIGDGLSDCQAEHITLTQVIIIFISCIILLLFCFIAQTK